MKTALVTGSHGFVGIHLCDELDRQGYRVRGFDTRDGYDIRDLEQVRNRLDSVRPDVVFHLAAQAAPSESFHNPQRAFEVNTIGSTNLLEAVRRLGLKTTVHLAGTSEEYGPAVPQRGIELLPRSPYAIAKVAMDYMGQLYADAYGMHVVVTRAYNHTGPGRGEMYAESSFAKQVAEVEAGKRSVIQHGNLDSVRNYTDVRDMVKAYILATELPSGVYDISSNTSVSISTVLKTLTELSSVSCELEELPSLKRTADFSFLEPDGQRFRDLTGWETTYTLVRTLSELLDYWRQRV